MIFISNHRHFPVVYVPLIFCNNFRFERRLWQSAYNLLYFLFLFLRLSHIVLCTSGTLFVQNKQLKIKHNDLVRDLHQLIQKFNTLHGLVKTVLNKTSPWIKRHNYCETSNKLNCKKNKVQKHYNIIIQRITCNIIQISDFHRVQLYCFVVVRQRCSEIFCLISVVTKFFFLFGLKQNWLKPDYLI